MSSKGTLFERISNRLVRHIPTKRVDVQTRTPIVSFTFDDIPQTASRAGAQILEDAGGKGTFYISASFIDTVDNGEQMATTADCRELAARGHELACHTYSHRQLISFSKQELDNDLTRNGEVLSSFDHRQTPRNFSVPFGKAYLPSQPMLKRRFRSSRGILPGVNRENTDLYHLLAVELRPDPHFLETADYWLNSAIENPGWLIFFTHDVSDNPSFYGCPRERLQSLVQRSVAAGCRILTVDAALEELGLVEAKRAAKV